MGRVLHTTLAKIESGLIGLFPTKTKYPPVFIVGHIRSGTTIIYQALANSLRFSYFPNISRYENAAHPFLSALLNLCRKRHENQSWENNHGHIPGKCAPSDGWEIFHRWYPYFFETDQSTQEFKKLKQTISAFEFLFKAPFINKNNSNSLRLFELAETFGNAYFVIVKRNIYSTIGSVLKARQKHGIKKDQFWGVAPGKSIVDTSFDNEIELVVFQYLFVNHYLQLFKERHHTPEAIIEIEYEEFRKDPRQFLDSFKGSYPYELIGLPCEVEKNLVRPAVQNEQLITQIDQAVKKVDKVVRRIFNGIEIV